MIWFIFTEAKYPESMSHFNPFLTFTAIFLSTMCALHFFWFTMFFKILGRYIFEGEAHDIQNDVSGLKKTDSANSDSPAKKSSGGKRVEKLE